MLLQWHQPTATTPALPTVHACKRPAPTGKKPTILAYQPSTMWQPLAHHSPNTLVHAVISNTTRLHGTTGKMSAAATGRPACRQATTPWIPLFLASAHNIPSTLPESHSRHTLSKQHSPPGRAQHTCADTCHQALTLHSSSHSTTHAGLHPSRTAQLLMKTPAWFCTLPAHTGQGPHTQG
jgi:hypothetical protein